MANTNPWRQSLPWLKVFLAYQMLANQGEPVVTRPSVM